MKHKRKMAAAARATRANPAAARAMQELRRSNAAAPHRNRARYRRGHRADRMRLAADGW
jgi:hypothetical protein